MVTKEQLAQIKQRMEAATPGPWKAGRGSREEMEIPINAPKGEARLDMSAWSGLISVYGIHGEERGYEVGQANAAFVAGARTDVALLVAEVERLNGWGLNAEQAPPVKRTGKPVWDMVVEDMKERNQEGIKKYGTALRPFNGRDALKDAYQEVLDLAVYLRQLLAEESTK
jgi:hypothetical protein